MYRAAVCHTDVCVQTGFWEMDYAYMKAIEGPIVDGVGLGYPGFFALPGQVGACILEKWLVGIVSAVYGHAAVTHSAGVVRKGGSAAWNVRISNVSARCRGDDVVPLRVAEAAQLSQAEPGLY